MGSSSSKSQSTATNYTNTDSRGVADNGSVLVTGSHNGFSITENTSLTENTTNYTTVTDGGAVKDALAFAGLTVDAAGEGYDRLLGVAERLFDRQAKAFVESTEAVAGAYAQAIETKAGAIDNKTIIVLAVAGAAAAAYIAGK